MITAKNVNGVSWRKGRQRWIVYIGKYYVGSFAQFNDAVEARYQAEIRKGMNWGSAQHG